MRLGVEAVIAASGTDLCVCKECSDKGPASLVDLHMSDLMDADR